MSKANPNTGQQMLADLHLDKAVINGVWHFQIRGSVTTGALASRQYPADVSRMNDDVITSNEFFLALNRMVRCARILEDTSDEDLKFLYEQKFGKGDGR